MSGIEPSQDIPAELVRRYDGADRIPQLSGARLVVVSAASSADDPVAALIQWTADAFERPAPGSALWRAILERRLAEPPVADPADQVLRDQILRSLERWPNLETWWHWLRTGWTAPPKFTPSSADAGRRSRGRWL